MNTLQVGFARRTVNPKNGNALSGYFIVRICEGVHDDIEANVVAFSCDEKTVILMALDFCEIETFTADHYRAEIAEAVGIPADAIVLMTTHTHTAPFVGVTMENAPQEPTTEYTEWLLGELIDAAREALADRKPAHLGYAVGKCEGIAFSRRFLMKDGSIATNPGLHNPDIVRIIGEPDTSLPVVRIDREGGDTVVIANYGCHPDTVGGNFVSADWPGVFRRTFEKTVPHTKAVFVNGTEGEINHINVFATEDELHGMTMDFDAVPRGFGHTEFMGNAVADAVRAVYDKVRHVDCDTLSYALKKVEIPTNRATPEQLIEAHRIRDLHFAGRDDELPEKGMFLTTVVAEAERMCDLEFGPDFIPTYMASFALGPIAFVGIAGEPFSTIGVELKKASGWDMVVPCALTDGWTGYFPNKEAYDEGGYESQSSPFAAGVAEILIEEGKKALDEMKKAR